MSEPSQPDELASFLGADVVLDTRGPLVYIGRLTQASPFFFVLTDADVHDMSEGRSTKEVYVMDARKYGIKRNRSQVYVRRDEVVSLSRLDQVVEY